MRTDREGGFPSDGLRRRSTKAVRPAPSPVAGSMENAGMGIVGAFPEERDSMVIKAVRTDRTSDEGMQR